MFIRITQSTFTVLCIAACIQACSSSAPPSVPTAADHFHLGLRQYLDGDYQEALKEFEIIRLQFPASTVSDSSRYFMGMSHFKREEYILASYEFNQMIQSNPSSGLAGDAQFMFAECYYMLSPKPALDQSYTTRGIDALQTFIEYYPNHSKVSEAEKQLKELVSKLAEKEYTTGVLYARLENYSAALIYYNTVIDRYYNTKFADDAYVGRIEILLRKKRFEEARETIKTFLEKYPESPRRTDVLLLQGRLPATLPPASSFQQR